MLSTIKHIILFKQPCCEVSHELPEITQYLTLKSLSIPSLPGRPMSVQVLSSGTGAQQQGFGGGGGGGARQRLGSRPSG